MPFGLHTDVENDSAFVSIKASFGISDTVKLHKLQTSTCCLTLHRVIAKQPYIKLWLASYMTRAIDKNLPDWKPVKFVSI